jgi:hypothetical protein
MRTRGWSILWRGRAAKDPRHPPVVALIGWRGLITTSYSALGSVQHGIPAPLQKARLTTTGTASSWCGLLIPAEPDSSAVVAQTPSATMENDVMVLGTNAALTQSASWRSYVRLGACCIKACVIAERARLLLQRVRMFS